MKVIIIDTDPIRIESFVKAFQDDGHKLTVVRNIAQALKAWTPPFDLILLHDEISFAANGAYDLTIMIPDNKPAQNGGVVQQVIVTSWNQDKQRPVVKLLHEKGYSASWTPYSLALIEFCEQISKRKAVTS